MIDVFKVLDQSGVKQEFIQHYHEIWNFQTAQRLLKFLEQKEISVTIAELQKFLNPAHKLPSTASLYTVKPNDSVDVYPSEDMESPWLDPDSHKIIPSAPGQSASVDHASQNLPPVDFPGAVGLEDLLVADSATSISAQEISIPNQSQNMSAEQSAQANNPADAEQTTQADNNLAEQVAQANNPADAEQSGQVNNLAEQSAQANNPPDQSEQSEACDIQITSEKELDEEEEFEEDNTSPFSQIPTFTAAHEAWHELSWQELDTVSSLEIPPQLQQNSIGLSYADKLLESEVPQERLAEPNAWSDLVAMAPKEHSNKPEPLDAMASQERAVENELSELNQLAVDPNHTHTTELQHQQVSNALLSIREPIPEEFHIVEDFHADWQPHTDKMLANQPSKIKQIQEEPIALTESQVIALETWGILDDNTIHHSLLESHIGISETEMNAVSIPEENLPSELKIATIENTVSANNSTQPISADNSAQPKFFQAEPLPIKLEPQQPVSPTSTEMMFYNVPAASSSPANIDLEQTNEERILSPQEQEAQEYLQQGQLYKALVIYQKLSKFEPRFRENLEAIQNQIHLLEEYLAEAETQMKSGSLQEANWYLGQARVICPESDRLKKLSERLELLYKESAKTTPTIPNARTPIAQNLSTANEPLDNNQSLKSINTLSIQSKIPRNEILPEHELAPIAEILSSPQSTSSNQPISRHSNPLLDSGLTSHFGMLEQKILMAKSHYQKAKELESQGLYAEALGEISKCLELVPDLPGGQEYRQNLEHIVQGSKDPQITQRLKEQGEQYWNEKRFPEAIGVWCSVLLMEKQDSDIEQKVVAAEQKLQEAMELWERAKFLIDSDQIDEGNRLLQECLQIYPFHGNALRILHRQQEHKRIPNSSLVPSISQGLETAEIRTQIDHAKHVRRQTQQYQQRIFEQRKRFEQNYELARREEKQKNYSRALQIIQELQKCPWDFETPYLAIDAERLRRLINEKNLPNAQQSRGGESEQKIVGSVSQTHLLSKVHSDTNSKQPKNSQYLESAFLVNPIDATFLPKLSQARDALRFLNIEGAEQILNENPLSPNSDPTIREQWQIVFRRCMERAQQRLWMRLGVAVLLIVVLSFWQWLGKIGLDNQQAWQNYTQELNNTYFEMKKLKEQYQKLLPPDKDNPTINEAIEFDEIVENSIDQNAQYQNTFFVIGLPPLDTQDDILAKIKKLKDTLDSNIIQQKLELQQKFNELQQKFNELKQKQQMLKTQIQQYEEAWNNLSKSLTQLISEWKKLPINTQKEINNIAKEKNKIQSQIQQNITTWNGDHQNLNQEIQNYDKALNLTTVEADYQKNIEFFKTCKQEIEELIQKIKDSLLTIETLQQRLANLQKN